MTITSVNSSTFLADTINFIRSNLDENIVDPISSERGSNERFVMTEYPKRAVKYPIITITDTGSRQEIRLGMQSEGTALRIGIEVRVWARDVKERDELFDMIYEYLRTNQLSGDDITGANLHDFNMVSVVNVNDVDTKSKVMEVQYLFICQ